MQAALTAFPPSLRHLLEDCLLPGSAPFEIHGAASRGAQPNDDYRFQGFRYVLDVTRDVLVREDACAQLAHSDSA